MPVTQSITQGMNEQSKNAMLCQNCFKGVNFLKKQAKNSNMVVVCPNAKGYGFTTEDALYDLSLNCFEVVKEKRLIASAISPIKKVLTALEAQNVKRWHTILANRQSTIGHHSAAVLEIVFWLAEELEIAPSLRLIKHALRHDYAEKKYGDLPTNKDTKFLKAYLTPKEEQYLLEEGFLTETLLVAEKELLKLADKLEALFFSLFEFSRGNIQFDKICDEILISLRQQISEMIPQKQAKLKTILNELDEAYHSIKHYFPHTTEMLFELIKDLPVSEQMALSKAIKNLNHSYNAK